MAAVSLSASLPRRPLLARGSPASSFHRSLGLQRPDLCSRSSLPRPATLPLPVSNASFVATRHARPDVSYLVFVTGGSLSDLLQPCCSASPRSASALAPLSSCIRTDPFTGCGCNFLRQPVFLQSLQLKQPMRRLSLPIPLHRCVREVSARSQTSSQSLIERPPLGCQFRAV